jgi:hypothetical protein
MYCLLFTVYCLLPVQLAMLRTNLGIASLQAVTSLYSTIALLVDAQLMPPQIIAGEHISRSFDILYK